MMTKPCAIQIGIWQMFLHVEESAFDTNLMALSMPPSLGCAAECMNKRLCVRVAM